MSARADGARKMISFTTLGERIGCLRSAGGVGCADARKIVAAVRGRNAARDRGDCGDVPARARDGRAGFALVGRDSSRATRLELAANEVPGLIDWRGCVGGEEWKLLPE